MRVMSARVVMAARVRPALHLTLVWLPACNGAVSHCMVGESFKGSRTKMLVAKWGAPQTCLTNSAKSRNRDLVMFVSLV